MYSLPQVSHAAGCIALGCKESHDFDVLLESSRTRSLTLSRPVECFTLWRVPCSSYRLSQHRGTKNYKRVEAKLTAEVTHGTIPYL